METSHEYGQSLSDTIKRFIDKFEVAAKEAEEEVNKYWKKEEKEFRKLKKVPLIYVIIKLLCRR